METGTILLVILAVLSALGLTWTVRSQWRRAALMITIWNLLETGIGIFLVMGMLYLGTTQVIVRYALAEHLSLPWTEELARLFLVWTAFWGAARVQRSDGHLAVAVLFNLLPPSARLVARLFGDVVALAFLAVVVWQGWWSAQLRLDVSMISLALPSALFAFSVPICGAVMIVHSILLMIVRSKTRTAELPMHSTTAQEF